MKRVLLLAATTGYQTRMFGEAAERLGVDLVFATDRCDQLADPWRDGAIAIRFHQEVAAVEAIVANAAQRPIHGILAVGDRPTVIAAGAARQLGLEGHPPEAAAAARDKRLTRECFRAAGLPAPWFTVASLSTHPGMLATQLSWPVVVKPATLTGSRGVMRADSLEEFVVAFERLRRLLMSADVRALQDPAAQDILVEQYIEGQEYALEGILEAGRLRTLAIFDKPDPLEGPFFEETLYITPSRLSDKDQARVEAAITHGALALGLRHGPIHAECRVNDRGVFVIEIAARPIGGLCARALTFEAPDGRRAGLEELLLRHVLGERVVDWEREPDAAGVMMIPIQTGGVLRQVQGDEDAAAVDGVTSLEITAKLDQHLVPLPEGSSYLGFIFAKARSAAVVEEALRTAHAKLSFVIDRELPMAKP
jgi:biotin carboxylase